MAMLKTIGTTLEKLLESGEIKDEQIVVVYDKHNCIKQLGKAAYAPIYLDWMALDHMEKVNHELRIWEVK